LAVNFDRAVDVPVIRADTTPDDLSYSSDFMQDTRNRLRQLEAEAEVRCFSHTCILLAPDFMLDYSICRSTIFPLISKAVLSNLFDTAGHLVNFPPAGGPQSRGAMASAWSASL